MESILYSQNQTQTSIPTYKHSINITEPSTMTDQRTLGIPLLRLPGRAAAIYPGSNIPNHNTRITNSWNRRGIFTTAGSNDGRLLLIRITLHGIRIHSSCGNLIHKIPSGISRRYVTLLIYLVVISSAYYIWLIFENALQALLSCV